MRGVWPGVDPPLSERAFEAARHLELLAGMGTRSLGYGPSRLRLSLTALVHLWIAHHRELDRCEGGPMCTELQKPLALRTALRGTFGTALCSPLGV